MRFGSLMTIGAPHPIMTRLFVSAALLLFPKAGASQANPNVPEGGGQQVVGISEKRPSLAGALELVAFPTIGYAYAGNWKRGLPSAAVRILGVALWGEQLSPNGPPSCEVRCVAGALMVIGGWIWAVTDAAGTARKTNEKRRVEAIGAVALPTFERGGLGVQIRLPVSR